MRVDRILRVGVHVLFTLLAQLVSAATGWRVEGSRPAIAKAVVIVAPHTSYWDAIWGMLGRYLCGGSLNFFVKAELFHGPVGWLLDVCGAIPVDRSAGEGMAFRALEEFERRQDLALAIAPEGSRSRTDHWQMGFYYIALTAGVPIVPIALDYGQRVMRVGQPFWPAGDVEKDFAEFRAFYAGVRGRHPDQAGAIQPGRLAHVC